MTSKRLRAHLVRCVLVALAVAYGASGRAFATDPLSVYFMICPRPVESPDQDPHFSFVFSRIRPDSSAAAVVVFRMEPDIRNALAKSLEGRTRDAANELEVTFREQQLPSEIAGFLAGQLAAAGLENSERSLNPLFPLDHRSLAVEMETPVFYVSNRSDATEPDLSRALLSMHSSNGNEARLANAFLRTCRNLGVPVEKVWYFRSLNLMIVESDESFSDLVKTLFSTGQ